MLVVDAERDERVLLGEPVQGGVQGRSVALVERLHHRGQAGPGELLGHARRTRAEPVADPRGVEAAQHDDLAGRRLGDGVEAAAVEPPQAGDPRRVAAAEVQPVADVQRPRAQQRDDLLAARLVAVDLEHQAGRRAVGRRLAAGEQLGQRVEELRDTLALQGGPEQHGYVGIEPLADLELDELGVGAGPVDLVDEHDRRDAQPLQGAHQDQRLRLHALDRRDDQHGAVQQAQGALDLGDEVRVAGGVDEVDGRAVDLEGHHRRADGDAPAPFERHRVGVGGAGVHAADRMFLHPRIFLGSERARLEQDGVGQRDLADVVKVAAASERHQVVLGEAAGGVPCRDGILRQALAVALGVGVARFDHRRHAAQDRFGRVEIVREALELHQ